LSEKPYEFVHQSNFNHESSSWRMQYLKEDLLSSEEPKDANVTGHKRLMQLNYTLQWF